MEIEKSSEIVDDESISNAMELWRLVGPNIPINGQLMNFIVKDESGKWRPSSLAFQNTTGTDRLSVYLADIVKATGRNAHSLINEGKPYVASLSAGTVRSAPLGQIIIKSPTPDEVAHADVCGKKNKTVREAMAKASAWEIEPNPDSN